MKIIIIIPQKNQVAILQISMSGNSVWMLNSSIQHMIIIVLQTKALNIAPEDPFAELEVSSQPTCTVEA